MFYFLLPSREDRYPLLVMGIPSPVSHSSRRRKSFFFFLDFGRCGKWKKKLTKVVMPNAKLTDIFIITYIRKPDQNNNSMIKLFSKIVFKDKSQNL